MLFVTRYQYRPKNAVAAALAWMCEQRGWWFEVYYDAVRAGRHYGGGADGPFGLLEGSGSRLGLLAGGLMAGSRHLEELGAVLQRFQTTVLCVGEVAFGSTLAAIAGSTGATVHHLAETDLHVLYDVVLGALGLPWPNWAVMLNATPSPNLEGVDAYLWPEIARRSALGLEVSLGDAALQALRSRSVHRLFTYGVPAKRQEELRRLGFEVESVPLLEAQDDYACVTARVARLRKAHWRGWILGDPVLASYLLPLAHREQRAMIYGSPQERVIEMLGDEIAASSAPAVLGRQYDDTDFFTLSRLGKSFQVVDPGRPPLPVTMSLPAPWSPNLSDPNVSDPTDAQLLAYARQGKVLATLVFWTGMIRESENLAPLMDLLAMTGLRAGLVLTAASFRFHPSPLDLAMAPYDRGGVFPHAELLLGSCGTGVAIESFLSSAQLKDHLDSAREELRQLGVPDSWQPNGWWSTMDVPLVPRSGLRSRMPLAWGGTPPFYIEIRYEAGQPSGARGQARYAGRRSAWQARLRRRLRQSALRPLFSERRPYDGFRPGAVQAGLAEAVRAAGFTYMLTKSGFGRPPEVLYRQGEFVALNYTAGRWDGWTPFETINHVADLRRAERTLLRRNRPGWLLGTVDTCLWAFSGELWRAAPGLAAIAQFVAEGGSNGRLINVPPRVVARYARLIDERRTL